MIWFALIVLSLVVVGLLVLPLLRAGGAVADRAEYDLAVYRDQLREVDADVERGLLTAQQAEAARTEIKRRMLAVADTKGTGTAAAGRSGRLATAGALAVLVPLGALALYGVLGNPGLPDQPFASRSDTAPMTASDIDAMVNKLAERLKSNPDDVEGWTMMARSARAMERYDQAAQAFARLIELGKRDADTLSSYGEVLLYQKQGFSPEAVTAFQDALRADAKEVRARFYLGMARFEEGDARGAIAIWRDLAKDAPEDAEWLPSVSEQIAQAGQMAGVDPETVPPQAPVLPPAGSTPAAAAAPADAQKMIDDMVGRLAARLEQSPDDAEGWKRLGRAYQVQSKLDLSKQAYGKAMALLPQDAEVRLAYTDVLLAMLPQDAKALPEEVVMVLREVEAIQPDHPDALYYLGQAAAEAGRAEEARGYWTRLLQQVPADSPARAALQKQIDGLGAPPS